jgi:hypothetical protein
LIISATQLQTFELCPRKWWFDKVLRLPRLERKQFDFGTVLHSVCERFLLADELGIDQSTNEPVDLYPEDWHNDLPPADQDLIKRLISAAITEGVLERKPNRLIEHEFRLPVIPGVQIMGFVDVLYPDSVEDHKTSKATRWFQSAKSLPENLQMLIYGKVCLERNPRLERVLLRHNQFCKDPSKPQVRKTEAWATKEQIEDAWENRVIATAHRMVEIKQAEYGSWMDTPEPDYTKGPCNAYGGCEFTPICTKRESTKTYQIRIDRANKRSVKYSQMTTPPTRERSNTMGVMDKLNAKKAAAQTAANQPAPVEAKVKAPAPAPAPAPKPAPAPVEAKASAPELPEGASLPPWVDPERRIMSINNGLGFKDNGKPCKVHAMQGKRAGLPQPEDFDIATEGDGTAFWAGKEGSGFEELEGWTPLSLDRPVDVKATERIAPEPEPEAEQVEEVAEESAPNIQQSPKTDKSIFPNKDTQFVEAYFSKIEESVENAVREDEKAAEAIIEAVSKSEKRGRKPSHFTLCINCIPCNRENKQIAGQPKCFLLDDLLDQVIQRIESDTGQGFWTLNAFARRDMIAQVAETVADNLNEQEPSSLVYGMGIGSGASEMRVMVDRFKSRAGVVIEGVVG